MPKRVLIYRMGGLGDSLLTYPVLEILTKQGWEVTVWGNSEYFEFAKIAGFCNKVTFYEPSSLFDLHIFFSEKRELFQRPNSLFVPPIPKDRVWVVDHYIKYLKLEGYSFSQRLNLGLSHRREKALCLIHPGSGSKKKNPEPEFFKFLESKIKNLGLNVKYILGPAEKDLLEVMKDAIYLENLIEVAKVLLSATLYIGLDSGISHLSSYLRTPSIVIFGPTDPVVWRPIGECVSIVRYEECLPCFPDVCEEKTCMEKSLILDKVEEEVKKHLLKI